MGKNIIWPVKWAGKIILTRIQIPAPHEIQMVRALQDSENKLVFLFTGKLHKISTSYKLQECIFKFNLFWFENFLITNKLTQTIFSKIYIKSVQDSHDSILWRHLLFLNLQTRGRSLRNQNWLHCTRFVASICLHSGHLVFTWKSVLFEWKMFGFQYFLHC